MDFEEYIRQSEPGKKERAQAWRTAIGLQDVDGLKPSEYLYHTARKNIDGDITIKEVQSLIDSYYISKAGRSELDEDRTEEADKVSSRIAEILSEKTFSLTPAQFTSIHRRLFSGLFEFAGQIRTWNITKKEWVLDGETVLYASSDMISETLEYDLSQEKAFSYKGLSMDEAVRHFTKFISNLWQIHAFGEGNTRTTAVFAIKYLRSLGFKVTNDMFAENSWYFRNALVRANYSNLAEGIHETTEYLELFFRNLLLGESHELKNRNLHVSAQSAKPGALKSQDDTLKLSIDETLALKYIEANSRATQNEIAEFIGKSIATTKRLTVSLQEKGLLIRHNGKRYGWWEVKM